MCCMAVMHSYDTCRSCVTISCVMSKDTIDDIQCPACESTAVYRDGWARTGKQRYLCLICGMQFTNGKRTRVKKRPSCLVCGSTMHLYRDERTVIRFRCSRYPDCRTYTKVPKA
jgi:transposase-like protein